MSTRYVMRILDDAHYWSEEWDPKHPHLERWVVELDCAERGIVTSVEPSHAKTFPSREAVRDYWLIECPPGKPWDYFESGITGDGASMPLARYMVMIETLDEAVTHSYQTPQQRWEVRIHGDR